MNEKKILILDMGHWKTRASFSNDDTPKISFHSHVGRPRFPRFIRSSEEQYLVDPPADISDMYYIDPVLIQGEITSEAHFSELIAHLQNVNKSLKSQDFGLFLAIPLFCSPTTLKKMAKVIFEDHKIPFAVFYPQPILALFSKGITNGLVVEMGHGMTQIAAVYNQFRIEDCSRRENFGGGDIDQFLKDIVRQKGIEINDQFLDYPIALNDIKKDLVNCPTFEEAKSLIDWNHKSMSFRSASRKTRNLNLPDGKALKIDDISSPLGELFFRPELNDCKFAPLDEMVFEAFNGMDILLQKKLHDKIYLSGGGSLIPGVEKRLIDEMNLRQGREIGGRMAAKQKRMYFETKGLGDPRYNVFSGVITMLNHSYKQFNISSKKYEEQGTNAIFKLFN